MSLVENVSYRQWGVEVTMTTIAMGMTQNNRACVRDQGSCFLTETK